MIGIVQRIVHAHAGVAEPMKDASEDEQEEDLVLPGKDDAGVEHRQKKAECETALRQKMEQEGKSLPSVKQIVVPANIRRRTNG